MTPSVLHRVTCRSCGGPLDELCSLGSLHLSGFLKPGQLEPAKVPLDVMICRSCDLIQLRHTVDADALYRQYWYLSGINETMKTELEDVVREATAWAPLAPNDVVIDIGANDGTLLRQYPAGVYRIAFEPAKNLYQLIRPHADAVFNDYFPKGLKAQAHAKVITAIAMFYDLEDPHGFLDAVEAQLHRDGIFVVQFQDLLNMVEQNAYDNLVHEHLVYYRLADVMRLLERHSLEVVDVEQRAINGGSIRMFIQRAGRSRVRPSVALQLKREETLTYDRLKHFAWSIEQQRTQLRATLELLKAQGKTIDMYGASTKANTLLQYCGLSVLDIRRAVERSPAKFGLTLPGSNIPIVSEDEWRRHPSDVTLASIWQFRDAILERESWYLDAGGTWLFPLPHLEIIHAPRLSTLR